VKSLKSVDKLSSLIATEGRLMGLLQINDLLPFGFLGLLIEGIQNLDHARSALVAFPQFSHKTAPFFHPIFPFINRMNLLQISFCFMILDRITGTTGFS